MRRHVAVVGAGLSGAALARALADRGVECSVFEKAGIVGGLCRETHWQGHLVSEFGPHIFRTTSERVWAFLGRFCRLVESRHHVETSVGGAVVPFPPSTLAAPAPTGYASVGDYLVAVLGRTTFERFYEHYSVKRWGVSAFELSPSLIPQIPVQRHDGGFFVERSVGIPEQGYTRAIEGMLDHPLITLTLGAHVDVHDLSKEQTVVWTGRLDVLDSGVATLRYRAVQQTFASEPDTRASTAAVVNYPDATVPYLRKSAYRSLLPWKPPVVGTEYSQDSGEPAYPVLTHDAERAVGELQSRLAREKPWITPHGRLGRFRYISMDAAIDGSLHLADALVSQ